MTIEERLTDALHEADQFEPSLDLFARVGRSISEDLAHRRRLLRIYLSVLLGVVLSVGYFGLVVSSSSHGLTIAAWEIKLFEVAEMGVLVIVLAPNIRRFARSFVADVFHLSAATGGRFLVVLDIAYYLVFTGLILGNADFGPPRAELALPSAFEDTAFTLAFLLLFMGLLHAVNIATLPFVGLVFNSVIRLTLRREAGDAAPPMSVRAESAESNAKTLVIVIVVLAVAVAVPIIALLVIGGLAG